MVVAQTKKSRVYIAKTENNTRETIEKALAFVGWKKLVGNNSTIFVKPNFTFPEHKPGVTTTPNLLEKILATLKEQTERVIVGESDGGNNSFKAEEAFKGHNMLKICERTGVELVNLSKQPSKRIKARVLGKQVEVEIPKILLEEIDLFFNIPVLKLHVLTGVSLTLKNLWGLHPDPMRCVQHQNLSQKLVLITKVLPEQLIIIDGTYTLEGRGPLLGKPKKRNLLLASNNPVAADTLACLLMGINPKKIEHIQVAHKAGLGPTSLDKIETNTNNWNQYVTPLKPEKTLLDYLSLIPFKNDLIAKLVFTSPITPLIQSLVYPLRTEEEKTLWTNKKQGYN